jgi:outer membrane lipoprotein-sorting protein
MFWAAALISVTAAAGQTQTPESFFKEFSARRDAIDSLQARYVQTTITPDETIVSEGTLTYARPKRLIFRYQEPPLEYMIDGLRVYEFDPDIEQIQIYELEDRPESEAYYLGFETDSARLMEAYDVRIVPSDDPDRHALGIEFTPKPPDDEEEPFFVRVAIQLRKGDLLPSTILIVNDEDSSTSFSITDYAMNNKLPETASHIWVPEGTTIVDNGNYVGEAPSNGALFPATTMVAPQGLVESEDVP